MKRMVPGNRVCLVAQQGCKSVQMRWKHWTARTVAGQPKRYEYPRYFFVTKSEDILGLCGQALDRLDIAYGRPKAYTISVARCAAVATLDTFVGPKY